MVSNDNVASAFKLPRNVASAFRRKNPVKLHPAVLHTAGC